VLLPDLAEGGREVPFQIAHLLGHRGLRPPRRLSARRKIVTLGHLREISLLDNLERVVHWKSALAAFLLRQGSL